MEEEQKLTAILATRKRTFVKVPGLHAKKWVDMVHVVGVDPYLKRRQDEGERGYDRIPHRCSVVLVGGNIISLQLDYNTMMELVIRTIDAFMNEQIDGDMTDLKSVGIS